MKLFTIGFCKKNAKTFFELLTKHNVKTLIDIRLNNKSQLSGFTKASDLPFLLEKICNIKYIHEAILAPTKDLLNGYQKGEIKWEEYKIIYQGILEERDIFNKIDFQVYNNACLLCSEESASMCHRKLFAEYLQNKFDHTLQIIHL